MISSVNKDLQSKIQEKISRQVANILISSDLKNLNEEQIEKLAKSIVVDNLKEQLKSEVKKSTFRINDLKDRWLSTFESDITRKNYKHNIERFLKWLGSKSIMEINASDADDYLLYLKSSELKSGTIRFRIAAASSFCNYLRRIDIIQNNYFLKINGLPRIKESLKIIPTEKDMDTIEDELFNELNSTGRGSAGKQRSARIMILAFRIIKNHALRIGALESLTIDKDGKFIADSKAHTVRGTLNPESLSLIESLAFDRESPFKSYKTATLKKQFERFLTRLYKKGKIDFIYSPHDFRHYAACSYYKRTHDIYATMRFLNHKNIATTQIYLKGLGAND